MLNKDQYNQDEYNNYYKQEAEGAEIKGYSEDEGGFLKKAILFLGLIALGVAGYFGFKAFNTTDNTITKEKLVIKEETSKATENRSEVKKEASTAESIEDKVIKTMETNKVKIEETTDNTVKTSKELEEKRAKAVEDKIEKTIQQEVATQVQEKLEENNKMSSADISKIVDMVMNKMDKEDTKITNTENDNNLLSALENSDNDTEEIKTNENKTVIANIESAIETKTEKVKTNNKVTVDNSTNTESTDLSALSEQIKTLLNMGSTITPTNSRGSTISEVTSNSNTSTSTSYEESLTQEIKVRKNEMRIIVVKRGDTLNKIAQRAYGSASSYQKIYDANPDIRRADRIYVGQKLRIPE